MQIKTLEYFLVTADTRSMSKAAEQLYISQQGLSKAILSLERELGVQLFIRGQNGLELTNEGNVVAKSASIILREHSNMNDKLRLLFRAKPQQNVASCAMAHVHVMPYIACCIFSALKKDFLEYQLDSCLIEESTLSQVLSIIHDHESNGKELILAGLPSQSYSKIIDSTRMQFFPLFSTDIVALAPKRLFAPSNRSVTPEELADIPLAYLNESILNQFVGEYFSSSETRPLLHATSRSEIDRLARTERAAILTDTFSLHVSKRANGNAIRILKPTLTIYVGFFAGIKMSKNDPERQYMVRFQEMIREKYRSYVKQNQVPHPDYN